MCGNWQKHSPISTVYGGMSEMRLTIYFCHSDKEINDKIRKRFGMPMSGMTINGELTCDIRNEDLELLRETEKRGFIQIRKK